MRRGEKILKALKILKKTALTTAEFIDIFPRYRLTMHQALNTKPLLDMLFEEGPGASFENNKKEIEKAERHRYDQLLRYLSKQGLIYKTKTQRWKPVVKGLQKIKWLEKKFTSGLPEPTKYSRHSREATGELKIIIFDIPEKERRKREWLRCVLRNLGFKMLQKSVWMGKSKIPIEFLQDLKGQNLLAYVEVFVITKSGSLEIKKLD